MAGAATSERSASLSSTRLSRAACGLAFDEAMLSWPPGPRKSDGVWAPAWYDSVERSTGFGAPRPEARVDDLDDSLKSIAEAARPLYERLARWKLAA